MALYRAERVSPVAGLGSGLAQAPFFVVLYRLFPSPTAGGEPNDWVFLDVLAALGLLAWWSSRRLRGAPLPVLRLIPYATVLVSALVPLAAAMYLLTTTAWTMMETAILRR